MVVCYIGNFEPFWSTENHVKQSLESIGVDVIPIQENCNTASDVTRIVNIAKPDFLMWTRTWGIQGNGFEMLRNLPCPSVAFHLDLYAGLKRAETLETEPWWKSTHVFTADGGSNQFWKEHGVNHHWSPPAVLASDCYLIEPVEEYKSQVLFTGSYGYHDEWQYRPQLIDKLKERYGDRFRLVEHGSEGSPWRGKKLNQLYASAKVIVGDSCNVNPMFKHEKYWSDRIPETLGRSAGFLIHPYIKGLESHYELGKELVTYEYGDFFNLFNYIDFYLDHDDERKEIAMSGFKRTVKDHTYANRMQNVLNVVLKGAKNIYESV